MKAERIIEEINKIVGKIGIKGKTNPTLTEKYPYWYIGVTDDAERRRQEHANEGQDMTHWHTWPADSVTVARRVERYFQDLGMDGDVGGGTNPNLVYIY